MMRALGRALDVFFCLVWLAAFVVFCATDWTPDRLTIACALGLAATGHFRCAMGD